MARLRLSLTIPGAVSLGAYEGGALAALIVAARALGEEVVTIDSIAAASAGSITGLLTARALLRGVDPVHLLSAAWVENVSIKAMRTRSTASPLSSNSLTQMATKALGPHGVPEGDPSTWQREPVRISMALTGLAGLTYGLADLARDTAVDASTFLDWYSVEITNTVGSDGYLEHAQAAIASGSNAIGFPAKRLDRTADRRQYEDAGLEGFPADGRFWYTDGGTVDNEPLGRTIDLAQEVGSDDDRLYLLIHADPAWPASDPATTFGADAPEPPWVRTGTHAFSIGRAQSIYEDLKRLEQMNSRLAWIERIAPAVRSGVAGAVGDAGLSEPQAEALHASLRRAVAGALGAVQAAKARARSLAGRPDTDPPAVTGDWDELLDELVHAATGFEGKDQIRVEVVSPLVDPTVHEAPGAQLAGAFFFHFGGFFDIRFRQSDFALGYRNMSYWLEHCLGAYLPGTDLSGALDEVHRRYAQLGWDQVRLGGARLGSLSFGKKLGLVRLAGHVLRVIVHDLFRGGA